jgi:hypothetical protein
LKSPVDDRRFDGPHQSPSRQRHAVFGAWTKVSSQFHSPHPGGRLGYVCVVSCRSAIADPRRLVASLRHGYRHRRFLRARRPGDGFVLDGAWGDSAFLRRQDGETPSWLRFRRCSDWIWLLDRTASRRVAPERRNRVSSAKSTIISPSQKPLAAGYDGYRAPRARGLPQAHNGTREK